MIDFSVTVLVYHLSLRTLRKYSYVDLQLRKYTHDGELHCFQAKYGSVIDRGRERTSQHTVHYIFNCVFVRCRSDKIAHVNVLRAS